MRIRVCVCVYLCIYLLVDVFTHLLVAYTWISIQIHIYGCIYMSRTVSIYTRSISFVRVFMFLFLFISILLFYGLLSIHPSVYSYVHVHGTMLCMYTAILEWIESDRT